MSSPLVLFLVDGLRHADHPTPRKLMPELGFRDVEASLFTGTPVAVHHRLTDYVFSDHSPFAPSCLIPGVRALWRLLSPRGRRLLNFLVYRSSELLHCRHLPRTSLIPPELLPSVAPSFLGGADEPDAFAPSLSLFDLLRHAGKTWLYAAPPRVSRWGARDSRVETMVLRSLTKGVRDFYFIKFGDLDRASHRFGPSSTEAASCRRATARRIATLVGEIGSRSTAMRWVVLSDHGFVDVRAHMPPPRALEELRRDGAGSFFVDSTMVRIRYTQGCRVVSPQLPRGASPLPDEVRRSFGLEWGSPQLGDETWIAAHGVVFWPDFFSPSPPKGMHGYLPHDDCLSPFEAHGFGTVPTLTTHAEVGEWLMEQVREG